MGYYLSKANKAIVDMIADRLLANKNKQLEVRVNRPSSVESIIRSAANLLKEYKWIKDDYTIKRLEFSILFQPKQLDIEFVEADVELIEDKDLFDIMNILMIQSPDNVTFNRTTCILEPEELESIVTWCSKHNYTCEYSNEILKVKKNV